MSEFSLPSLAAFTTSPLFESEALRSKSLAAACQTSLPISFSCWLFDKADPLPVSVFVTEQEIRIARTGFAEANIICPTIMAALSISNAVFILFGPIYDSRSTTRRMM